MKDGKNGEVTFAKRFAGFAVFILAIMVLAQFMGPRQQSMFEIQDDGFTFQSDSDYSYAVTWDQITMLEERDTLDFGTMLQGTDEEKEKSGTWENSEFGEYQLWVDPTIQRYLIIYTSDQTVVVNLESVDSTDSLFEAVQKVIPAGVSDDDG